MNKFNNRPNQNERAPFRRDNNRKPAFRRPFQNPADLHPSKVDNSHALYASFDRRTVTARYHESNDQLVRRFKRVVENSGVMSELKRREYYETEGQKARLKAIKARKRAAKKAAIQASYEEVGR